MSTRNVPPWYGVSDGPVAFCARARVRFTKRRREDQTTYFFFPRNKKRQAPVHEREREREDPKNERKRASSFRANVAFASKKNKKKKKKKREKNENNDFAIFRRYMEKAHLHHHQSRGRRRRSTRRRDTHDAPVIVPRMCANESPSTSSTDTPEALSEAISRSSFDKRFVSMFSDF